MFDIGDEVVKVDAPPTSDPTGAPPSGWVGRVVDIYHAGVDPQWPDVVGLLIDTWPLPNGAFHNAEYWRKVDKPDPEAVLRKSTSRRRVDA